MKKIDGNKLVAVLLSAGMVMTLFAACSINTDELGEGISELGNAFYTEGETQAPTAPSVIDSQETDVTVETSESQETTAPEPTVSSTPTVTPTPLPERVDFSEYTDNIINTDFTVTTEEFAESTHSDDDQEVFATFEGTRLVVTKAATDNIRDSINLIVDGFYQEAEGAYKRVAANAKAEYNLSGVVEVPATVNVDFQYSTYGRAFSVLMIYTVEEAESGFTAIDFASFDMKTGQFITMPNVSKDPEALDKVFRLGLENALKHIIPAGTADPVTGEISTTDQIADTPKADDFETIFVAPTAAESTGSHFVMVYGIVDGEVYNAVIEIDSYADYFNRYGTSIFLADA